MSNGVFYRDMCLRSLFPGLFSYIKPTAFEAGKSVLHKIANMAERIKEISKYPEHSINMALKKLGTKDQLEKLLVGISKELEEVSKDVKKSAKKVRCSLVLLSRLAG